MNAAIDYPVDLMTCRAPTLRFDPAIRGVSVIVMWGSILRH